MTEYIIQKNESTQIYFPFFLSFLCLEIHYGPNLAVFVIESSNLFYFWEGFESLKIVNYKCYKTAIE